MVTIFRMNEEGPKPGANDAMRCAMGTTVGDTTASKGSNINGGAIIDHRTPRERRFVAVAK
jgi:hypothetical protein